MKNNLSIDKININHIFNDSFGRTSGRLICAFLFCLDVFLGFPFCLYYRYNDGILGCIALGSVAGTLYGIGRFTNDKEATEPTQQIQQLEKEMD